MCKRATFAGLILGAAAAANAANAADEPKWLKEARAREAKSLAPAQIASKDGFFKVRTPGKSAHPVEKVEGSYSVEIGIGGDASVYCEVYPEVVDLANALRVTFQSALEQIGKTYGKVEAHVLEASDAGAYGAVPYIQLTWLYRVSSPEGAKLGSFKQFVMEKGNQGVYCSHDDLGYTRTFAAITRGFAETLEVNEPQVTPYYVEVATASMSGARIGVITTTMERDADGDTRARQMTALFMATNDGAVQSHDSAHINWIRPDGSLINAIDTGVSNGEIESSLTLKETDSTWTVEGELQGKAIKSDLPKGSKPRTWVEQARELRALAAQPDVVGREHAIDIWLAEDPDKLTVAKTKILANKDAKHLNAAAEIGTLKATLTLEKSSGMMTGGEMRMGPVSLVIERVYVNGSF